jgi:hypothetical protein
MPSRQVGDNMCAVKADRLSSAVWLWATLAAGSCMRGFHAVQSNSVALLDGRRTANMMHLLHI